MSVFSNSTRGGAHSICAPNLNWWIRARMMPSCNTADLAVSKWKTDSMHSPHRWSSESGASLKGLPHIGQRGDTAQGISFQHRRHQELWGRLSILWQPAQLLGRHKSRRIDPANLNPAPIPSEFAGCRIPDNGCRVPVVFHFGSFSAVRRLRLFTQTEIQYQIKFLNLQP